VLQNKQKRRYARWNSAESRHQRALVREAEERDADAEGWSFSSASETPLSEEGEGEVMGCSTRET
jgi:hypothetical protein